MKRRDFLAVAGISSGAVLTGTRLAHAADEKQEQRGQVYQCQECGAIVEVLEPGSVSLSHCGKPMKLLAEITTGEGEAKHLPKIEKIDGGYKVTVGATEHPMLKAHHIAWIELIADGKTYRQFLEAGAKPQATFAVEAKEVSARAHCNLHGLWLKKA